jgi:hypothetical protein
VAVNVNRLIARDGSLCGLCRGTIDLRFKFSHPLSATVGHIIPRGRRGCSEKPTNLRLEHLDCNQRKGDRLDSELSLPFAPPQPPDDVVALLDATTRHRKGAQEGGKKGSRNQSRGAKVRGGRNQPREAKVEGARITNDAAHRADSNYRKARVRGGRIGVRTANHNRWHVGRRIYLAKCSLCKKAGRRVIEKMLILFIGYLLCGVLHGQSIKLNLGDSTLYQAAGGGITMYTPHTDTTLSIGLFNGRLIPGLTEHIPIKGWDTYIGNRQLSLNASGGSIFLPLIGVATEAPLSSRWLNGMTLFAGMVGASSYYSPFAFGSLPQHFGFGYRLERRVGYLDLTSLGVIVGRKHTSLESVVFRPESGILKTHEHVTISVTMGLLENFPTLNALASLSGDHVGGAVARNTWVLPQGRFNATNESGYAALKGISINGGLFRSNTGRGRTGGLGWGAKSGNIRGQVNVYQSTFGSTTTYGLTERLRHRFSLTETVDRSSTVFKGLTSKARYTADLGIAYSGNRLSLSVGHQELFNPTTGRWQRVLAVSLSTRIFHDSQINLQTITLPDGSIGYAAYGSTWLYGTQPGAAAPPSNVGRYIFSGRVVDEKENPVDGASISLGGQNVYTDHDGNFSLSSSRKLVDVKVLTDEFLVGTWQLVSTPATAQPDIPITIVVTRR